MMLNFKHAKKVLAGGVIISTIASASMFIPSYAHDVVYPSMSSSITFEEDLSDTTSFDLEKYISSLNFLTQSEKEQLLKTYEQTKPLYEDIDKIYDEIDSISDRHLDSSEDLYKEIDEIYSKRSELWDKLFDHANDEQNMIEDDKEFIRASGVLTEEEKKSLIEDQEEMDKIYMRMDERYEDLQRETEPLYAQVEGIYKQISDLDANDETLWEKIQEMDNTPILY